MLKHEEIINYAIKGLQAEIAEYEKKVRKGYKYLEDIRAGKPVKTPKTENEIMDIIQKYEAEIKRLQDEISDLDWQLALEQAGEKTLIFDKWDNYDHDDPKRMRAIFEVLAALQQFDTVHVKFDYEGRTRHEIAANVFKDYMLKMGYTEFDYIIDYNYVFTIKRKTD